MASDPYDRMLLSERPTTVVTQATRLHDTMPDPHGSSADEEALFSGLGQAPAAAAAPQPSAQAPGSPLAAAAAQAVLTGDDATGAATVRSGPGAAIAVSNALAAMPEAQRRAWSKDRPKTAAALADFAKATGQPSPVPASSGLGGLSTAAIVGIAAVAALFLFGRRRA